MLWLSCKREALINYAITVFIKASGERVAVDIDKQDGRTCNEALTKSKFSQKQ